MLNRMATPRWSGDRLALILLAVPAVLLPLPARAAQVGCFITAVLLGMMFVVGLCITEFVKHLLARFVWQAPRTPWLRMFAITWLELVLGVAIAAGIQASYWFTVVLYLPFAALLNWALLARLLRSADRPVPPARRYGIILLLPFALPVSIQIAGVLWTAITNMLTFNVQF